MQIRNLNGLSMVQLHEELIAGGRFVTYQYCVSFFFFTFRPTSDIYFVPSGKSNSWQSLPFTLITLLFGWWGLPWGPVHTIGAIKNTLQGGTDVTELAIEILACHQQATLQMLNPQFQAAA